MQNVLVAGIGNIFFGDDGFGCEVDAKLAKRSWPDQVKIVDFESALTISLRHYGRSPSDHPD